MNLPRHGRRGGRRRLSVALDRARSATADRHKACWPPGEAGTAVPHPLRAPDNLIAAANRACGSAARDHERIPAHSEHSHNAIRASASSTWVASTSRVGTHHFLQERRHDAIVEREPEGLQRAGLPDFPAPPYSKPPALRAGTGRSRRSQRTVSVAPVPYANIGPVSNLVPSGERAPGPVSPQRRLHTSPTWFEARPAANQPTSFHIT